MYFFKLVCILDLTALLRILRTSLCACLFSADVFFTDTGYLRINSYENTVYGFDFYLKSLGLRSMRLHFWHSARFLSFPFSKKVFITISPPQSGQINFCVATVVREFLLAPAIVFLHSRFAASHKNRKPFYLKETAAIQNGQTLETTTDFFICSRNIHNLTFVCQEQNSNSKQNKTTNIQIFSIKSLKKLKITQLKMPQEAYATLQADFL